MVRALRLGRGAQTMRAPSDTYVIAKRGAQTTHAHKVSARCAVHTLTCNLTHAHGAKKGFCRQRRS